MELFQGCGPIYVAKNVVPDYNDISELIVLCSGSVTNSIGCACIIVGEFVNKKGIICVNTTWVLDSISNCRKEPFEKYIIYTNSFQ